MKVLIAGSEGQLGWELQRTVPSGINILPVSRHQLDIVDQDAVIKNIEGIRPDVIVNCAAYTAVDKAEQEEKQAYLVNAEGAGNLAEAAKRFEARIIQISTDYIFDGEKAGPYTTSDHPNPVNVYGKSKLKGEQIVQEAAGADSLILRTSWVYSSHGNNFVKTMLRLLGEKDQLTVVSDQVGKPTWAKGLAEAVWTLIKLRELNGVYHWADWGETSWHGFAVEIQEQAYRLGHLEKRIPIVPISTSEYPTPATRPLHSVLSTNDTEAALGKKPRKWQDSLGEMLKDFQSA